MSPAQPGQKKPGASPKPATPPAEPPLKPQRKLLIILSLIFALWVAALITLYFRTPDPVHAF